MPLIFRYVLLSFRTERRTGIGRVGFGTIVVSTAGEIVASISILWTSCRLLCWKWRATLGDETGQEVLVLGGCTLLALLAV